MYGMTPMGVFFTAIFPLKINEHALCQQLHFVQKSLVVCGPELSLLGLIFTPIRMAEQMVNVRLDRHGLPHFRLGLAVFRIEDFFLFGELPALLFQRIHFRELRPA